MFFKPYLKPVPGEWEKVTWWLPGEDMRSFEEGHGELRGPVIGRSSDGSSLETETMYVDGRASRLTLKGPSTVDYRGGEAPLTVMSDEFVVEGFGEEVVEACDGSSVEVRRDGQIAEVVDDEQQALFVG